MLEALVRRIEHAKPADQLLRLRVLITLGGCAQDLGEPQAATTYYQQALEWSTEIGDLARIAFIHRDLGTPIGRSPTTTRRLATISGRSQRRISARIWSACSSCATRS